MVGKLHVNRRDHDATLDWMSNTAHTPPISDCRERHFILEQTVVLRLHDIGMSFRTGMKISLCYSNRDEIALV